MKLSMKQLLKIELFKRTDYFLLKKVALLFQSGFSIQQICQILNLDNVAQDQNILDLFEKYPVITKHLSLKDSCEFIYSYQSFLKEIKTVIIKALAYPIVLLVSSNLILIFFKNYFIPELSRGLTLISFKINSYIFLIKAIIGFESAILILFFIFLLIIRKPIFLNLTYEFLYSNNYFKTFLEYYSLRFLIIFKKLLDLGLTTQEILILMSKLKDEKLVSYLAFHFKTALETGIDFISAILKLKVNHALKEVLLIAFYSPNKLEILEDYSHILKETFLINLKKLTTKLQYFSYLVVALVIMLLTQITLLPLESINQL